MTGFNSSPQQILRYWHTLEYLAPFNLEQQIDQADSNKQIHFQLVKEVNDYNLPWLNHQVKNKLEMNPNKTHRYQLYFGVFNARLANDELSRLFGGKNIRDTRNDFLSCCGRFSLDNDGIPIADSQSLSSLPWALGHLQSGDFSHTIAQSNWNELFKYYVTSVSDKLKETADSFQSAEVQFDAPNLKRLIAELIALSGWNAPKSKILAHCFVVEESESFKNKKEKIASQPTDEAAGEEEDDDDTKILNSFYINDLRKVKNAFAEDNCGAGIKSFLRENEIPEANKFNLDEQNILKNYVAPKYIPLGRWASDDEKYQSLMQQAGINIALAETEDKGGLFSVNGPPGTGKSTMLRDIIAALIVKRAVNLADFENPNKAFSLVSEIPLGNGKKVELYKPDSRIVGYEMVVASSNNTAVQNITQEIPNKNSIGRNYLPEADYFQKVAENIFVKNDKVQPWGMVAAVLGKSSNLYEFRERFWFDKNNDDEPHRKSLQTDLFEAETTKVTDWQNEKTKFIDLHNQVSLVISQRQKYFDSLEEKRRLMRERESSARKLQISKTKYKETEKALRLVSNELYSLESESEKIIKKIEAVKLSKPFWIWFLIRLLMKRTDVESYEQRMESAQLELDQNSSKITLLKKKAQTLQEEIAGQKENLSSLEKVYNSILKAERMNEDFLVRGKEELGAEAFADEDWWNRNEYNLQLRAPWLDQELNQLRARLFLQAMKLHETFIRVARSKISKNLRLWMEIGRGNISFGKNDALLLWQTFFLAVPVVSTTFASFGKMFADLERESLGWLLIDEAGQAVPQAAVGAIWRAKRSIVVGDPLQIEPVIGLDGTVIEQVRDFYKINAEWSLNTASVQTLADRANRFGANISGNFSKIWVGCPLRVHRRCIDPMFKISNTIAYSGKMVYATAPPEIKAVLGKSRWIDSRGKCVHGHWVDELWDDVKKLLGDATEKSGDFPKIYIISPFRDVARELKKLVVKERTNWLPGSRFSQKDVKSWAAKSIGTVHTFQGKEEETVIFVLGVDETSKSSAQWAANKPNMLNVAATRAKFRFYIVGNSNVWSNLRNFEIAYHELKISENE